jgi:hypothetical protein
MDNPLFEMHYFETCQDFYSLADLGVTLTSAFEAIHAWEIMLPKKHLCLPIRILRRDIDDF